MSTDTNTSQLIINKLSKAQYEAIATPSETELYLTPDTTEQDIADAVSVHNASNSAHSTLFNAKVTANNAITAGTHSKITYDSKGLVTGGSDLALSDLNITATASEINVLDGITATTTELNYVDGVTSNIQTQLNNKMSSSTKYGADLSYSNSQLQLKDQDGNLLGTAVTIESSPAIDSKSITTNSSSQLQTVGVIDSSDSSTAIKTWTGTKAQFEAIATKDDNTIYTITDDDGVASATVAFASITGQPTDNSNLATALNNKQATLVSGTNIKTINSTSLLGSGNIPVITSETLNSITSIPSTSIIITNDSEVYSKTITENTTFTFDVSELGTLTNKTVTFEVYLTMSTVYTLTFPNTVTWVEEPSFTNTGKYLLAFKSFDGGSTWLGNLETQWS